MLVSTSSRLSEEIVRIASRIIMTSGEEPQGLFAFKTHPRCANHWRTSKVASIFWVRLGQNEN